MTTPRMHQLVSELRERLEELLEQRQEYFNNRSDKWLESEKAGEYEDKTYNI